MATQTRKQTRAKFVSKQTVEQVGASLQGLPEKTPDNYSLRQAIEQLRETIETTLAKGYSYEDLIPILAGQGIDIQSSTLKRYILTSDTRSKTKRSSSGKTKTRQARKKLESATTDALVTAQEEPSAPAVSNKRTKAAAEEGSTPAPASAKRGREQEAAKVTLPPTATETTQAQAEPAKKSRSRRASTASSALTKTKSRTTSTRGRKTAKA